MPFLTRKEQNKQTDGEREEASEEKNARLYAQKMVIQIYFSF